MSSSKIFFEDFNKGFNGIGFFLFNFLFKRGL